MRVSRRADDQALSNVGPLTAFCGVAAVAAGVLISGTLHPGGSAPQIQAQPVVRSVASEAISEPTRLALSPEETDQMLAASNLVSGAAAPVQLPVGVADPVPDSSAPAQPVAVAATSSARRSTGSINGSSPKARPQKSAHKSTQKAVQQGNRATKPSAAARPGRHQNVLDKAVRRVVQQAAQVQRFLDRAERRAEKRDQRAHKWASKHAHKKNAHKRFRSRH